MAPRILSLALLACLAGSAIAPASAETTDQEKWNNFWDGAKTHQRLYELDQERKAQRQDDRLRAILDLRDQIYGKPSSAGTGEVRVLRGGR